LPELWQEDEEMLRALEPSAKDSRYLALRFGNPGWDSLGILEYLADGQNNAKSRASQTGNQE
jgi:hypothetical protein